MLPKKVRFVRNPPGFCMEGREQQLHQGANEKTVELTLNSFFYWKDLLY